LTSVAKKRKNSHLSELHRDFSKTLNYLASRAVAGHIRNYFDYFESISPNGESVWKFKLNYISLRIAATGRHAIACKIVLSQGIDIDELGLDGLNTLHYLSKNGLYESCRYLIGLGASVDSLSRDGLTALQYAAEVGNISICRLLIRKGADVLFRNSDGMTALDYAALACAQASCDGPAHRCTIIRSIGK
jgi:hypothetical protein